MKVMCQKYATYTLRNLIEIGNFFIDLVVLLATIES